jgi:hypothetical protein
MTQQNTTDYQITDYGIEHAQYFQGHGTSFTKYAHASLGCGDDYRAALEDALEQASMSGYDIELSVEDLPEQPANAINGSAWEKHERDCEEEEHSNCESELYYYVGLRWN